MLSTYFVLYIFLYIGYLFIIFVLHSSYRIVSTSAVLFPLIFLLVLLFFSWKRADSNAKKDKKKRKSFTTILTLGSLLPVFCLVILSVNEYKSNFTTEKWIESDTEKGYMVDDLLQKYDLKDMTREEIISLLGTPTDTEYFKEDKNIVYYLGNERGLISIDSEWLVVDFDDSMKVTDYKVVTD